VKRSIRIAAEEKSQEEKAKQEKPRTLGPCPMGFAWIKEQGGCRCAGGSHFVSDSGLDAFGN
jgi:hypothetical protein